MRSVPNHDLKRILTFSVLIMILLAGLVSPPDATASSSSVTFSEHGLPLGTGWCVNVSYFARISGHNLHASRTYCTSDSSLTAPSQVYGCEGGGGRGGGFLCGWLSLSGYSYENKVIASDGSIFTCDSGCSGGGSGSHTAKYVLGPFDFYISNSGGISINPGSFGTNTITAVLLSGSPQPVSLSCGGSLPTGVTCSFNPSSGNATFYSQLTVNTTSATPLNSYSITVNGTSVSNKATISRSTSFILSVVAPSPFDFGVTSSSGINVNAGDSGSTSINLALVSGSTQPVSLSCAGLPTDTSCSFNPPSGDPSFTSELSINTSTTTLSGNYSINVTATGGGISRNTSLTLTVTYSATFSESGLTPGTNWCVTVNGVSSCTTSSSQTVSGLSGTQDYQYQSPISSFVCTYGCAGTLVATTPVSATYTLLVLVTFDDSPTNGGTISCANQTYTSGGSDQFPQNSQITCTANPASGYRLSSWSGLASGTSDPVSFNVVNGGSLTANFAPISTSMVTVTFLDSQPSGGTITCSAKTYSNNQNDQFAQSSTLSCTANVSTGYKFTGWSGLAYGSQNPVTFNIGSGGSLTANFAPATAAPITPFMTILAILTTSMAILAQKYRKQTCD